jgi:hypothetical protein
MLRFLLVFAVFTSFSSIFTFYPYATAQSALRTYEKQRAATAVRELGFIPETNPEGRTIAFVQITRRDVFESGELWPTWFNMFHWLTKRDVVARELLFREGEPYREQKIQETMRNLRDLGIFSLVSIVPVQAGDPSKVGVVVYTRDVLSFRLNTGFQFTERRFDYLLLQLTEGNLLGRDKGASVRFYLQPFTFSFGQIYADRRVYGSNLALEESVDVIFNRESGRAEGSRGSLLFGRPFYNLNDRWSYTLTASYVDQIWRGEEKGKVATYKIPGTAEAIPIVFNDRRVKAKAALQYRRGESYKQAFSTGLGFRIRDVGPNRETNLQPGQEAVFEREVLPRTRRELFPYIGYALFLPRFVVFENLATFGQSENVQVGPNVKLGFELPLRAFGSSSDSFVPWGELRYVWAGANTLGEAAIKPSARLENGRVVDQYINGEVRGATASFMLGRLVFRGTWEGRRYFTSNVLVTLGGDNGLRGYGSRAVQKRNGNLFRANFEYRTLPLCWQSVHLGAVLFYDVGSVYRKLTDVEVRNAVGAGLRLLFPQFNRYAFRFDFGIPLDRKCCSLVFSFGSGQALPLSAVEDLTIANEQELSETSGG